MGCRRNAIAPLLGLVLVLLLAVALSACGGGGSDETSGENGGEAAATAPNPASEEAAQEEGAAEGEAGEEPAPGTAARSVKVRIENFAYSPEPVRVQEGGKVIWQNEDSTPHTATADDGSFNSGPIEEGKISSETFKEAGTFTYHCEIHPSMHGTIEVIPAE